MAQLKIKMYKFKELTPKLKEELRNQVFMNFPKVESFKTRFYCQIPPNYMFLAEDLEVGEAEDEEIDLIKLEKVPFEQALKMVESGEITHAASVVTILKIARLKGF